MASGRDYAHFDQLARTDLRIEIAPDCRVQPWGRNISLSGSIRAEAPLPVADVHGHVAAIGLRIHDIATREALAEARLGLPVDADIADGLPFSGTVTGYGLRPEVYDLSLGLVVDPIAWYGASSNVRLSLLSSDEFIDVRALLNRLSVEQLCAGAEAYFQELRDRPWMRSKPFDLVDAQTIIPEFGFLVRGLRLAPGMRVMDFGAGTGWATRWLWQLGLRVISTDVSETALEISADMARRTAIFEELPPIEYLHFNGRRFDLPDACVDRVFCMAALHHVPNIEQVFSEFGRIVVASGRIGFAEPGARHSLTYMAQHDMQHFCVVENDIDLVEIQRIARKAGFGPVEVMLQNALPETVSLEDYLSFGSSAEIQARYVRQTRERAKYSQIFFFDKL